MIKTKFINMSVSDKQKVEYEEYRPSEDDMQFTIEEMVIQGYKVSFGTSNDGGGFNVAITDRRKKSLNYNCCVSTWGGDVASLLSDCAMFMTISANREESWEETKEFIDKQEKKDWAKYKEFLEWKRRQDEKKGGTDDV